MDFARASQLLEDARRQLHVLEQNTNTKYKYNPFRYHSSIRDIKSNNKTKKRKTKNSTLDPT